MTENCELKDYLGTRFETNKKDGSINLTQPQMDAIIIELVGLNYTSENVKIRDTPTCSNKILEWPRWKTQSTKAEL